MENFVVDVLECLNGEHISFDEKLQRWKMLRTQSKFSEDSIENKLVLSILRGEFLDVLQTASIDQLVVTELDNISSSNDQNQQQFNTCIFLLSITSFYAFLRENFTGPPQQNLNFNPKVNEIFSSNQILTFGKS